MRASRSWPTSASAAKREPPRRLSRAGPHGARGGESGGDRQDSGAGRRGGDFARSDTPAVAQAVVDAVKVPIIGCGAGPACHGCIRDPRCAWPDANNAEIRAAPGRLAGSMKAAFADYLRQVEAGEYPGPQHTYEMSDEELTKFTRSAPQPPGRTPRHTKSKLNGLAARRFLRYRQEK